VTGRRLGALLCLRDTTTHPNSLGAAAGLLLERFLPEPPDEWHPVARMGTALGALERLLYRDRRGAGVVHAAAGVTLGAAVGALSSTAGATTVAVSGRMLGRIATEVGDALERGDLDRARRLLPSLVGRDPTTLDEAEVVRAVVESVAENTVDAAVAPALWAAALGGTGALGYRAANTLDSMVGHHSPRYERFGWASARLDDALGWVPARVTASLVALVRPTRAGAVLRTVRRDASAHPSPNAGVAEAAFAAALGVRLGGTNRYGDRVEERPALGAGPPPARADIRRAVALSRDVSLALAALLAVAARSPLRRPCRLAGASHPPSWNRAEGVPTDGAAASRPGGRRESLTGRWEGFR
jgi:adenosylcobinamide-phosphate synthase